MMRATLALTLTLIVAACSSSYGEDEKIAQPIPSSRASTDKSANLPLDAGATPSEEPPKAPPKPTTYANCEAALSTIETCARPEDVLPIGAFASLRTTPRAGESTSQCTGCSSSCQTCHHANSTRVFDYHGLEVPINWILGCEVQPDGSVGVVEMGPILEAEESAVAAMPPYAHPYFTLTAAVRAARDDTAALMLARLKKGECRP